MLQVLAPASERDKIIIRAPCIIVIFRTLLDRPSDKVRIRPFVAETTQSELPDLI